MKTLNLVYSDKSDIYYETNHYPDGQQNIVILDIDFGDNIQIKLCLNNTL